MTGRRWPLRSPRAAEAVVSTRNEPLITVAWAVAILEEAHQAGSLTGFVSNGDATPKVLG